ncbi:MAG TPA: DUF6798 domain-containing protein [Bryobacteraceae bacterium]|nr:DUF6798 domain-containing protein [Bryobacteraceae bacterium]
MKSWATAAAALALALLSFFQFPGHTYLQQDSQIYVPILEHLRDPSVLRNDILVEQPHVAFTVYDEAARLLRGATGLGFGTVLEFQQIVTRALGIWGLFLMASALGLPCWASVMVGAIVALGARILGPEVLTWEYEPTPRAFAVPLLLCGVGLAANRRYLAAGMAGAAAFLYHPPTAVPFWLVFGVILVFRKKAAGVAPLAAAAAVLVAAAALQAGGLAASAEAQNFFGKLTPSQTHLQQIRTAYVWISLWPGGLILHYLILSAILLAAFVCIRRETPVELRIILLGLPALGLASMALSWLLLERSRWAIVPEIQPMRALLFVALAMQFVTAAAAVLAVQKHRSWEALGWFAAAYLLPVHSVITRAVPLREVALVAALSAVTVLAARFDWRCGTAAALAAFFAIPLLGGVVNYPRLHTPELAQLSQWSRNSTPPDAVFLFPDAGHALFPGIFRSEALRAVYVDWKAGGQVNYLPAFGEQWWFRWQQTMADSFHPEDLAKYSGLGVRYVVLHTRAQLSRAPVFENSVYAVYELP